MSFVFPLLFWAVFLACVIGAVYFFCRAIRSFIVKKGGQGILSLVLSLVLGFLVYSVVQAVFVAREKARRCSCASQLRQIVLFMKFYANDHREVYPPSFDDMVGTNYLSGGNAAILVHPASHHKACVLTNIHAWTDYAYVSGLSEADPVGCVAAFCLPENHKGEGVNVAFIDGRVGWFNCKPYKDSTGTYQPTFQELTNSPALFYGTTNLTELAELMARTRIIYPNTAKR